MNLRAHNERLLDDVLGGDNPGLRDALFAQTLRVARRRHRLHQLGRAATGLGLILGVLALFWRVLPPHGDSLAVHKSYAIIRSRPLPAVALVTTQPLNPNNFTEPLATVAIIETQPGSGGFRELNDTELLALAPGPAALVRQGPHSAELVFVNATDQEAPRSN